MSSRLACAAAISFSYSRTVRRAAGPGPQARFPLGDLSRRRLVILPQLGEPASISRSRSSLTFLVQLSRRAVVLDLRLRLGAGVLVFVREREAGPNLRRQAQ